MIGMSKQILQTASPEGKLLSTLSNQTIPPKIIDCLLVHECLHIIFSETFAYLYHNHKELLHHFTTVCIPEGIQEHLPFVHDLHFIQDKKYRDIAGTISRPDAHIFLQKYFGAFNKDMIRETQRGYMLPFLFKDMLQEYAAKPPQDHEDLYQKDKASYIKKILT